VALAAHLAQDALKAAQKRKYKDLEAEALAAIGNAAWKQGDAKTAVARLGQAVELFQQLRLYNKAHSARGSLAVALVMTGQTEDSALVSKRALDYFRNQGDMRAVAKILSNLGYVAFTLGEYDTARSYLRRLMQMEEALHDRGIALTTALNLGLLELREGRFKMARKPLTRAYHLAGEAGDRVSEGSALTYLALLALHEGLPDEALNYMELADTRLAGSGADEALIMRYYLPVVLLANNQINRAGQLWRQKPELQAPATYVDDLLNLYRVLEYMLRATARQGVVLEPEALLWAKQWRDEIDALLKRVNAQ
jgi:tetratricopeptide (TPR) repeat protein